jgi:phosphoglycerate dehydrogenase-like enzyme
MERKSVEIPHKTVMVVPEAMRDKPDAPYTRLLLDAGFQVVYPRNPQLARGLGGESETIAELAGIQAVLAGGGEPYTERVFAALPELRVVARAGVGYDRVDVQAATRHGVVVTITPTANHEAVAEHTLALLLALAKNIVANDRRTREGGWRSELARPLRGQTLGLVGLGRIGRSVALRAMAMGMRVIAFDVNPPHSFVAEHPIRLVSFEELLEQADIVSLHCPLTPQTQRLFHRDVFRRMKPGALFINTARGGLVVERDLVEALIEGTLGGAGLDVFEIEPPAPDNPLFALPNVVVSPHVASADTRAMIDMGVEAARCIVQLSRNEWPSDAVVNNELKTHWRWERSIPVSPHP